MNQDTTKDQEKFDTKYEIKAVGLLSLAFGLVGLDRFIINPLFPVMSEELGLSYQDLGLISGILALAWGMSSIVSGNLSDRFGSRRVLVVSVVLFSLLVATTGLATGLISLLIIRSLMGFAEGGFVPASIVATINVSHHRRKGLNIGIQQMAMPFFGLGLGPIIAVWLLAILPGWEWVFGIVALPGLIVAYLLFHNLKDPATEPTELIINQSEQDSKETNFFRQALGHRNIVFATLSMVCFLTCLLVTAAFMPNYLTDYIGLDMESMSIVLSFLGLGGLVGMIGIPALSDFFGRKNVMVFALMIELIFLVILAQGTKDIGMLSLCLFVISCMNSGVVAVIIGPLISETVPISIAATATGLVVGLGEIVGGAIAPAVAGAIAERFGIQIIPHIVLYAVLCGFVIVCFGIKLAAPDETQS